MEEKDLGKRTNNNGVVIIILALVIVGLLGFIAYDKLIQKDSTGEIETSNIKDKECNCSNAAYLGEKLTSFKKIELTNTNQEIKIGKKTFKVRKNSDGVLYINDENPLFNDSYYPEYVYLTDKFAIFTNTAQFKEFIGYALSEKGRVVINDNNSQMENFRIIDGYLHADGGELYSTGYDFDIKDGDVIIKFIDNTLIVTPFK